MQATQRVSSLNPAKAALAAIALAGAVVIGLVGASFVASSAAPTGIGAGAGAGSAPLVLDPDARGAGGQRGSVVHVAQ